MVMEIEVWRVSLIRGEGGGRGGPELLHTVVGPHFLLNGCSNSQVNVDWNDLSACCLK
jgi:hypothetical protein